VAGGYSPSMLTSIRSAVLASRALHDGVDDYHHGEDQAAPPEQPGKGLRDAAEECTCSTVLKRLTAYGESLGLMRLLCRLCQALPQMV
jgi:hypothetical protein